MKFAGKNIILDKEINELDILVLRFIAILEKYTDYVIISGYVAILFGRSRITEDIDVFITEVSYERFAGLYDEIKKDGFWCLNAEKGDEIYRYLADGCSVRFAIAQQTIPNFEVKFAKKMLDKEAFRDRIQVKLKPGILKISSPERQIAFKRYYLKSDKDVEDADHIEHMFKGHIDKRAINKYRLLIEQQP
ncbi:MAG TPA: hypothetical protein VJC16_03610 [Candidatus Nanoarchaeia archaeon]|nr:hypothetical protein [Candidatus Nanoarchaeia archaeon]